ncbi:MAG: ribosome small subunit-dependent GTPase A [Lachnospiraceae bacterium]|nr:ribosome small subunit-dependent GTPase A [Lachnospiraceae bacterium]
MLGKITKGIAGFYYVHGEDGCLYECKAKGVFRKDGIKPLVGDNVNISVLDREKKLGNLDEILERRSELLRPAAANIDQVLVVFAAAKPAPNFNLLDRFLIRMGLETVPVFIGFNKCELVPEAQIEQMREIYTLAGYRVHFFSVKERTGLEALYEALSGKTTALAGPSGVGKSSLMNYLCPQAEMETGDVSRKIERGRHTTRHSEIFVLRQDTYVMDTPGFSSLYVNEIPAQELWEYFPEMKDAEKECRFTGCCHMEEPDCGVKSRVASGIIAKQRYESYRQLYTELSNIKRY